MKLSGWARLWIVPFALALSGCEYTTNGRIQKTQKEVEQLKAQVSTLEEKVAELERQVETLRSADTGIGWRLDDLERGRRPN